MNAATIVQTAVRAIEAHDIQALSTLVADDFDFPLPGGIAQLHKNDYIGLMGTLVQALPDLSFNVSHVEVQDNKFRLTTRWTGTQLGLLTLPGLSPFQPTGRSIALPETIDEYTVSDDRIVSLNIQDVPGGGIPGLLTQLGVIAPRAQEAK
ncbi:MAG: ester cyclase [Chloroflexota bacterium]|nr:ester cyclase [Chloroflexota bacterium]